MAKIPFASDIPFSLQEMREEFDRMLDRVWHSGLTTAPLDGQDWAPRLDVYEHPDRFHVRVEIPGVRVEDVEVTILDNVLTIKGVKTAQDRQTENIRCLRSECRYGSFCRRYELPAAVEDAAVKASSKDGVLDIMIPKVEQTQGRTVKVEPVE
ncbi:MAG: Hsp20/alpha crystallin family protein [Phycisphaerae bacterium]